MAYPAGYRSKGYGGQWGLQPGFSIRLQQFMAASGGRVRMGGGFRSIEASNAARKRKGHLVPVAKGGNSWHNYGHAGDLVFRGKGAVSWAHANAARYGLYFPMKSENWHIQPIEARGGARSGRPIPRLGVKGSRSSARALPRNKYASIVSNAATKYGIPQGLLGALLYYESSYNPRAISSAGARGIAQFMPGTWKGNWNPFRGKSSLDPAYAIPAAAIYLKNLHKMHGTWTKVLSAYNSGRPNSKNPKVKAYINRILPYLNSDEGFDNRTADYASNGKQFREIPDDLPEKEDITLPPLQPTPVVTPEVLREEANFLTEDIDTLTQLTRR